MPTLDQLLRMLQPSKPANGFDPEYLADESVDPSVRADAGLGAMTGELRNRLFQAERTQPFAPLGGGPSSTSPFEVRALGNMLHGYEAERADPRAPLNQQATEVAGQRTNDLSAINEGFGGQNAIEQSTSGTFSAAGQSPMQQREIYKRTFTEQNSPATLQNDRIKSAEFMQGRQLNAQNRQTTAQMAPSMQYADIAREQWDRSRSQTPGASGVPFNDIKQIGKNGITYQNRQNVPQVNPNTLMSAFQKELGYNQGNGNNDIFATFGQPNSPTMASDNAVRAMIANSGMHPESQAELMEILSNAEDRATPFDQLAAKYQYDMNDADIAKIRQLLLQFRGF